jgi:hypothetical protein
VLIQNAKPSVLWFNRFLKPNSWNGEEMKRTRPSPAFRFLPFSPRRLYDQVIGTEILRLFSFVQFDLGHDEGTRMNVGRAIRFAIRKLGWRPLPE